ncbi:MAG TPA: regulatory protein GemA [Azospirillum sp.]|nr:regulatory protein GemA [Azospirillum sp.]
MALDSKKSSVIHVAVKQLGMTDEDYRSLLFNIAGVRSSRDLDDSSFDAVMFRFHQLGFRSTWNRANYGYRADMATPRQVAAIRKLWGQFTDGKGTDATLGKWLESRFKVASVRFLTAETARKAMGALNVMVKKKGKVAA